MVPSNPLRRSRAPKPEATAQISGDVDEDPLPRGRRGNLTLRTRFKLSDVGENAIAGFFATYLRVVNATSRHVFEPVSNEELFRRYSPFIATSWHGQAFMLPFVRVPTEPVDVLVSRNSDADHVANLLMRLGCGVIRGSGVHDPSRMFEKGAVAGFRGMKASLDSGRTVGVTADFLRYARQKASMGIISLARASGRPIIPTSFVSSRRVEMSQSWDRLSICLPFGRTACVFGDPITVPANADDALMEAKRQEVENALNAASARAYAIVDKRRG
jgi:lysophospholipid acyltransferase (LPLAT)-like uncharacterized protein